MSRYRLYVENVKTEHVVEGKSPTKALRTLVDMAERMTLVSQDGRYGRALRTGSVPAEYVSVSALTEPWSRRRLDPLERTTRL